MEKPVLPLNNILLLQILATLFISFIFTQYLFIENVPANLVTIIGVFQELLTIPAILFTVACLVIVVIQIFLKKNYSPYSFLLLLISLTTVAMIIIMMTKDF